MYFANNDGLLEYDGVKWVIYPIHNQTNVRSVKYDSDNDVIYAGAFNEFGYYKLHENGQLQYHSLTDKIAPENKKFNEIWNIHKSGQDVYFQGDREIFKYHNNTISLFSFKNKIDCSALINNSLIITSTQDGVNVISGDLLIRLPESEILKGKKVCAILPYKEQQMLFVTDFNGMFLYDGEKITPFNTDLDEFLKESQVFCATTNGSQIAFGTVTNGIIIKDINTGENIFANTHSGLQNNTILSVAFDKQNNLWLGLDKGIDYVLVNSPISDLFSSTNLYGSGYTSLLNGNTLYLGTNQGLYYTTYPIKNSPKPLHLDLIKKMQGQVWCLTRIDNTIFCGTDKGAYIIDGQSSEQIYNIPGTWNFKPLEHHPGYILGCSYQGLFILKKVGNKWIFSNFLKEFDLVSSMFEEDHDGKIWFSHWIKGIYRLTLDEKCEHITKIEQYDNNNGLPGNRNNTLFRINDNIIFSSEYGFYAYNSSKNIMEAFPPINKIFGGVSNSMRLYESPVKDLICISGKYLGIASPVKGGKYKVDSLSLRSLQNKLIIGFENLNFVDENNLLISTEDGFSWIDLQKKKQKPAPFNVFIKGIYTTSEKDSLITGMRHTPTDNDNRHTLPYKNNSLRFEFIAPEYRNEDAVSYSFYLENFDQSWSNFSSTNTKEYTKLRKGDYTFHVRAKNGFESTVAETFFKFTVLPPWYESTLAICIYSFLTLLFIAGIIQWIRKLNKQKEKEMEIQKENELKEQEKRYQADAKEKEKEIIGLKNQQLQYSLRHKSQELASSTMNLIRKNEILLDISGNLTKIREAITKKEDTTRLIKQLGKIQNDIRQNIEHDNDWKKFEQNFDLVYEDYLKRLSEQFPQLNIGDKKLCAYLKMGLSSKDIAPLLNMSVRSVEMARYRLRKKIDLDRDINLSVFLQQL